MLFINFYGTLILCSAGGACLHSNLDIHASVPHQQPAEESNDDAHSLEQLEVTLLFNNKNCITRNYHIADKIIVFTHVLQDFLNRVVSRHSQVFKLH